MFARLLAVILTLALLSPAVVATADEGLLLHLRSRKDASPAGQVNVVYEQAKWDPTTTGIIVCDMWDQHWCRGAERRVSELAKPMNEVLKLARARGIFIIHAPSTTTDFYRDTPQRRRAQQAKFAKTPVPLVTSERWGTAWCWPDATREPGLPIDDFNMGCDCPDKCEIRSPWTRQIATIEIGNDDAITDDGQETFNLLAERGIDNVIIMGVHLNMCVLGRPFAIRQLTALGKNVVMMRDMTDTMYDSREQPKVNHFRGTDLVVAHVEKHWCPSITSTDLTGMAPFAFAEDKRPDVVLLVGEDEYRTEITLPSFAATELESRGLRTTFVMADAQTPNEFPGMDAIDRADLLFISVRRRFPSQRDVQRIRDYVASGKPVVGIRTASHGFAERAGFTPPNGHATWQDFDHAVLGGNYTGHHGNSAMPSIEVSAAAKNHPIVQGLPVAAFTSHGSLYKSSPLADTATVLLTGKIDDAAAAEPVAWTNRAGNSRVFYTSLGHPDDFELPEFRRLLAQGVFWALDRNMPEREPEYHAPLAKAP